MPREQGWGGRRQRHPHFSVTGLHLGQALSRVPDSVHPCPMLAKVWGAHTESTSSAPPQAPSSDDSTFPVVQLHVAQQDPYQFFVWQPPGAWI